MHLLHHHDSCHPCPRHPGTTIQNTNSYRHAAVRIISAILPTMDCRSGATSLPTMERLTPLCRSRRGGFAANGTPRTLSEQSAKVVEVIWPQPPVRRFHTFSDTRVMGMMAALPSPAPPLFLRTKAKRHEQSTPTITISTKTSLGSRRQSTTRSDDGQTAEDGRMGPAAFAPTAQTALELRPPPSKPRPTWA